MDYNQKLERWKEKREYLLNPATIAKALDVQAGDRYRLIVFRNSKKDERYDIKVCDSWFSKLVRVNRQLEKPVGTGQEHSPSFNIFMTYGVLKNEDVDELADTYFDMTFEVSQAGIDNLCYPRSPYH